MTTLNIKPDWLPPAPFSSDQKFFLKYYGFSFLIYLGLSALTYYYPSPLFSFISDNIGLMIGLFLFSVYWGCLSDVFIHNATHGSFRPRVLNSIIAELTGLHQLYGFKAWQFSHLIHHRYPDHPQLDAHYPGDKGYWKFTLTTIPMTSRILTFFYFRTWGVTQKSKLYWRLTSIFWFLSFICRASFIFLMLGPFLFKLFFIPSYISMILFAGVINYYTHRRNKKNEMEIYDLNTGLFKVLNIILFGVFSHKTHHLHPSLFNPAKKASNLQ